MDKKIPHHQIRMLDLFFWGVSVQLDVDLSPEMHDMRCYTSTGNVGEDVFAESGETFCALC